MQNVNFPIDVNFLVSYHHIKVKKRIYSFYNLLTISSCFAVVLLKMDIVFRNLSIFRNFCNATCFPNENSLNVVSHPSKACIGRIALQISSPDTSFAYLTSQSFRAVFDFSSEVRKRNDH